MTSPARRRWAVAAPAAALVLAALCLRAPFSAVGPVLDDLGDEESLSTGALALVTALPLVCFGLISPFAPALASRVGVHRAVVLGMGALAAGIGLRLGGAAGLFAGTVLLTGGIAIVNVLLPAAARSEYGSRSAVVVGMTTASMAASASAGAGLAQPFTSLGGSARIGLLLWLVPVVAALSAVAVLAGARRNVPWLPAILETEAGISSVGAGALVAVAAVLGAPASLIVPPLAVRRPGQIGWVIGLSLPTAVAIIGLMTAPDAAPVVWALLYGLGTGAAFPLTMTLVLQRTRDVAQTGRLSASAQSIGYLIAATGPLGVGLLHEATDDWTAGLLLLLVVLLIQTLIGVVAGRARLVSADA